MTCKDFKNFENKTPLMKELNDAYLDNVHGGKSGSNTQLENPNETSKGRDEGYNEAPVGSIAISTFSKTG